MARLFRGVPPTLMDGEWPEHDWGQTCWCQPEVKLDTDFTFITVHNSLYELKQKKLEN